MSEFNINAAPDILQLNMENISKELNDLIVTGEQEYAVNQQFSIAAMKATAHSVLTAPLQHSNTMVPSYIANAFYGQQQLYSAPVFPDMQFNFNYPALQPPTPTLGGINNVPDMPKRLHAKNYLAAAKNFSHYSCRPMHCVQFNATGSPSYEFHYLRSRGENERKFSGPISGQGNYRKVTKLTPKNFHQKMQNSHAENESIKFDLSTLDFLNTEKEKTVVENLFDLLRDLHSAVAETPASLEVDSDSQFEETFAPSTKKSTMPFTLNIQNQVKQACRKLTIFTYEMQRILSDTKIFNAELHAECDFYLNQLRQYLHELEMYKRLVMEHKHGKFLRDEVQVHAERLSLLLEHTNRQIREVNIRVLAVDWYIGVKYRGDIHVAAAGKAVSSANDSSEVSKKSKIGVINEILQLCNVQSPINNITTAEETTKMQTATTKPDNNAYSTTKLINDNQEVVNVQPLLCKNNHMFNVYKSEQTKKAVAATNGTSCHGRHPVFYIG